MRARGSDFGSDRGPQLPCSPVTQIPEKPSLDGLEAKWRARWEADGTYRFDRTKTRDRDLLHRHAAAHGERHAALGPRLQLHAHRPHRPLPAHAGQGGLLPDGLGRQRAQRRAPRAAPHRHHRRPHAPLRPRLPPPREGRPEGPAPSPSAGRTSSSCARRSCPSSRRSTTTCGPTSGCRSTGTTPTRPSAPRRVRTSQRGFLRLVGARPRLPQPSRPRCGTSTCGRRWPRPSWPTASCPAPTTSSCSPGPTATPLLIDTTRPELLPACVAVVAHPDDERFQPLFGQQATTPLFGASVPIVAHELADPEKGTGVAMICTFGDTTDVTWWRELSLPVRAVVQRDGRLRPVTWGEPGWETTDAAAAQPAYDELAGKTVKQAQARIVELLTEAGGIDGEHPPDHPLGEVLGERHPAARDRHEPAVVHPLPAQGRDARPRQGAGVVARLHAGALRELGQRPHRRLEHHPAALLRRAVPRLVPDRRRRRRRLAVADPRRRGVAARSTPPPPPRPGSTRRSATSRAGSPPTPT